MIGSGPPRGICLLRHMHCSTKLFCTILMENKAGLWEKKLERKQRAVGTKQQNTHEKGNPIDMIE